MAPQPPLPNSTPIPTPPDREPPVTLAPRTDGPMTPPDVATTQTSPSAGLAQVALIMLGEQPLGQVLEHVAEVTAATVPGASAVSVTLVEGTKPRSAGFSGPLAAALDERQYTHGFGPCLDAARTGTVVIIHDTTDCTAYPEFAELALRHGVTSVLSVGMPMLGQSIGALNIYCTSGSLTSSDNDLGRIFAAYASVALSNAVVVSEATDAVEQMREAMASRAGIEQAKGILMARHGVDADEAFARLAHLSQTQNRKLREIAEDVVRSSVQAAVETA